MITELCDITNVLQNGTHDYYLIVVTGDACGKIIWTGDGFENISASPSHFMIVPKTYLKNQYTNALMSAKESYGGTINISGI